MAKKDTKQAKERFNLTLDPLSQKRGTTLARLDKRSFSGLVETLLDREWERLFGKEKA